MKKKYCFNYSAEGVRSFLPLYIRFEGENLTDEQAYKKAIELVEQKWPGHKITVYN